MRDDRGMNKHLIEAIANLAVFIELSEDDVVDPDSAVKQLEGLAATLGELGPAERRDFARLVTDYALEEESRGAPADRVACIRELPDALGLIEDPPQDG